MILQIIVPYLFYQCLVKFLKKLCFLYFLIFLILNTFFYDFQFGFMAKHSTEHACATLLNYLNSAIDSGLIPAALFLDVQKVFDSLTHKILLLKLSHLCIRGNADLWFLSYLSGRFISVNPHFSNPFGIVWRSTRICLCSDTLFNLSQRPY